MVDFKRNRHSFYSLKYHLVVVTKFSNNIINEKVFNRLKDIFTDILENSWKCSVIKFNGKENYIHVYFEAPPHIELSKLVNNIKTVSSRRIRKEFDEYLSNVHKETSFWDNSYLVITDNEQHQETIVAYLKIEK